MPWKDVTISQRVYELAEGDPLEWMCAKCGFQNRPRPVTNSLGTLPADHPVWNPAWRASHCEQCGAERV